MDNLFTQVHSQQITIEHSTYKSLQQISSIQHIPQIDKNETNVSQVQQNVSKSKFKIVKTIEQSHIPKIKQQTTSVPALPEQTVSSDPSKSISTSLQTSKQQPPKKEPQPFKIENLYISAIRANSAAKPPSPVAQKKPKIWQMFKNKRQNREALAETQTSTDPPKSPESLNNTPQAVQDTSNSQTKPPSQCLDSVKIQDPIKVQASILPNKREAQSTQDKIEPKLQQQEKIEVKIEEQLPQLPKVEQKPIHKPLFEDQKDDIIQFHHAQHHPLQRINQQPPKVPEPEPQIQHKPQQSSIPIQSNLSDSKQKQQNKVEAAKEQNEANAQNQYNYGVESQSEASPSQREQMIVDYTHNKKYQEELQKANRQKIRQLQLKLKHQEQINRQLEKSLSLPIKFITSAAVGLSTASIAWAIKKNKNMSILLGVATTLATFVFSY